MSIPKFLTQAATDYPTFLGTLSVEELGDTAAKWERTVGDYAEARFADCEAEMAARLINA